MVRIRPSAARSVACWALAGPADSMGRAAVAAADARKALRFIKISPKTVPGVPETIGAVLAGSIVTDGKPDRFQGGGVSIFTLSVQGFLGYQTGERKLRRYAEAGRRRDLRLC